MNNNEWITIPVLPCISMENASVFWGILGFKDTYRQNSPYKYLIVERGGYQIHFVQQKEINANSYRGCLVLVDSIEKVHAAFSHSLKAELGRVPTSGLPRISKSKLGQTRFTITDPSGNSIIFIQLGSKDEETYEEANKKNLSPLGKSIALAVRLRDYKEDYLSAARALDNVLTKQLNDADKKEHAEALIMRAELALILKDKYKETQCYELLAHLNISKDRLLDLKSKHIWTS